MKDFQRKRFKFIIILIALIFSSSIIRIIQLMFFQREVLLSSPLFPELRERGFIVDRKGEKLALSLETYSVYIRPGEIEQKKLTAQQITSTLDMNYEDVLNLINKRKPFVWIQRQVDIKYLEKLEKLDIKGVYIEKEYKRFYPFQKLASHVIGFSGVDNVGLEGIEYLFDDFLLPEKIDNREGSNVRYKRGYTVVLTIDRYIQEVIEEELERALEQTKARLITAIVLNPDTGEILALSNKPDYDLNNFSRYSEEIIRNKAITDSFEPGSTFKIFVASVLLDSGLVDEGDIFNCEGTVDIENVTIHDTGVHGKVDFRQVLEKSCNVGMVESVKRIEKNMLFSRLREFGFGTIAGIDLPGEAKGILRNPKDWSRISKYMIAIGQELSVTPLQLITAAGAIAHQGVLMQPQIVKRIEKPDGTIVKSFPPMKIRRVIRETTSKRLLDILTGVLSERGTGYKAYIEGYTIAGKTGTAQIADTEKGGYLDDQFYASFLGFVPYSNPRFVVLVTLDRPVGEVYGGQTAAPVFKNIVERIAPYLNILPSLSEIYILKDEK